MANWKLLWSAVFEEYKDKIFLKSQQLHLSSSYIIFTGKGQIEWSMNGVALSEEKVFLCTWTEWPVEVLVFPSSAKLPNELRQSSEGEWNSLTKAEYFLEVFQGKSKRSREWSIKIKMFWFIHWEQN